MSWLLDQPQWCVNRSVFALAEVSFRSLWSDRCLFCFLKDGAASHLAQVTHQPLCLSSCTASFIGRVTWKYVLVVALSGLRLDYFCFIT